MKIVVATAWNELYQPLADIAVPLMERYCERHGYDFAPGKGLYKTDESDLLNYGDRCKVTMYKSLYDRYDAYVWLDVDCLVMNSEVSAVRDAVDFQWSCDVNGPGSGWFWATCVPDVHLLLHRAQHRSVEMASPEHPLGRAIQDGLNEVGQRQPTRLDYKHCLRGKEVGHCYWDYDYYGWGRYKHIGQYEPGDWLCTFPAVPLDQRIELMKKYAKDAK